MPRSVLITGATGKQGGGVIDALLRQDADFQILAVPRDASSSGAQKLKAKSSRIQLVEGNLDRPEEIFVNAAKLVPEPIWGVFSVQVPIPTKSTQDAEERQGKELVDAALKNKVKHFVYSSVDRGGDASIDNPTPIPHFISKHNIEHHLIERAKGTGMSWTILRPTAFLQNLTPDFPGKVFATCWKTSLREKPLQVISVSDIGFFGAQAFLFPDQYRNKCLSLAGDELTFTEMERIFREKCGRNVPLTFNFVSRSLMWLMKDFRNLFQWFYDSGYDADISALKKIHPQLKDFESWLESESGFECQKN